METSFTLLHFPPLSHVNSANCWESPDFHMKVPEAFSVSDWSMEHSVPDYVIIYFPVAWLLFWSFGL